MSGSALDGAHHRLSRRRSVDLGQGRRLRIETRPCASAGVRYNWTLDICGSKDVVSSTPFWALDDAVEDSVRFIRALLKES